MGSAFYRGPLHNGIRPRKFLAATKVLIDRDILEGDGGKSYNPNWRKDVLRKKNV